MSEERIIFLIRHFMVGGLERVILAQVPLVLDIGVKVTVAVLEDGRDNALIAELDPRAEVALLPRGRLRRIRALDSLVRGKLVLVHLGDGSLFPTARPGLARALRVVRFCHSDYAHTRSWVKNRVDKLLSLGESTVVAVGGRSTRFLIDDVGIAPAKVITLPNVLPPLGHSATSNQLDYRAGDKSARLLVSIQSFYPHKAHDALLRGFSLVAAHEPRAILALVGDGSENLRLWELARSLGILDRVQWLGGVWNRLVIDDLLSQADVFVSMSRFEGVPISVLEAKEHGLRLVLSDIPGHRDAGGDAATYVPVDDERRFADAVVSALRVPRSRPAASTLPEAWAEYRARFVEIVRGADESTAARVLPSKGCA
jgi:glycosyltransferase involved in cell wall biosynthesis